jgi:hypothetical protein
MELSKSRIGEIEALKNLAKKDIKLAREVALKK